MTIGMMEVERGSYRQREREGEREKQRKPDRQENERRLSVTLIGHATGFLAFSSAFDRSSPEF